MTIWYENYRLDISVWCLGMDNYSQERTLTLCTSERNVNLLYKFIDNNKNKSLKVISKRFLKITPHILQPVDILFFCHTLRNKQFTATGFYISHIFTNK